MSHVAPAKALVSSWCLDAGAAVTAAEALQRPPSHGLPAPGAVAGCRVGPFATGEGDHHQRGPRQGGVLL